MRAENTLLDDIYASIVLRGDYAEVLARLSPLLGSHAGTVVERAGAVLQFRAVSNLDPSIMEDYNRYHCRSDVWVRAKGELDAGVPFIGSRCVDPAHMARTDFYDAFLKPHDIWDLLSLKLGDAADPVVYLTFFHAHREVFNDENAKALAAIGPHIERAHRLRVALARRDGFASSPLDQIALTRKEREIASLILEGLSYAAIAEAAKVSRNTVHWHARNVFSKAGVRSKAAFIVRFARRSPREVSSF